MRDMIAYWVDNGGIKRASELDFRDNGLDYMFEHPISSYGTISGWLLFDTRGKCEIGPGEPIQWKISLSTFSGELFETTTDPHPFSSMALPGTLEAKTTGPTFRFTSRGPVDLRSGHRFKFYSDEVE